IHESAYKQQLAVEKGEEVIVGVNKFTIEEDLNQKQILKVDPELEMKQKERLKKLRERRDNDKVKKILTKIKEVASTNENLFPYVLEAVKAYATVGEISNALRDVFGEYTETVIV
ncbi:MAG: methylmalonyl-CoA mutase family protein, partial [Fervidobacterium sp.]